MSVSLNWCTKKNISLFILFYALKCGPDITYSHTSSAFAIFVFGMWLFLLLHIQPQWAILLLPVLDNPNPSESAVYRKISIKLKTTNMALISIFVCVCVYIYIYIYIFIYFFFCTMILSACLQWKRYSWHTFERIVSRTQSSRIWKSLFPDVTSTIWRQPCTLTDSVPWKWWVNRWDQPK